MMGLFLFVFAIRKFFPNMSDGAFPGNFSRLPVESIMMDSHCISLHMLKVMLFTDYTMVNYHETPPFGKGFLFYCKLFSKHPTYANLSHGLSVF